MGLNAYLGSTQLFDGDLRLEVHNIQLGDDRVTTSALPVTTGLDAWFDATLWSGTGNLNSKQGGNWTASLYNATLSSDKGGIMVFQSSSVMQVSGSANSAMDYSAYASYSIVLIAKSSGSSALQHGRLLNGVGNNWLFGTWSETQEAWYNGSFVSAAGTEDNLWRIYTGIQHSALSSSFYVNNIYKSGLASSTAYGFNGLAINKGQFITSGNPASGEYTYAEVGQILVYNRPLTQTEIGQIFNYFSGSYF